MKLAILFLTSIGLFAQAITTSSLTLTAPAPPPVKSLSTSIVGNAGNATYYYWVVAKYTGGNSVLSPSAIVVNAPNTLSVGNYVRIDWNIQVGADTYDVLRTTTPNVPNGDCNCAIALAQAGTTFSDQGGALSAYTITSAGGASTTCIINNLTVASPAVSCSPISWGGGGSAVTAGYGIDIVGDEISVNTAIIPDWPGIQSGVANYCRSTTGSSAMTCALATTLTVYTSGSCFVLSSNFANVTTATLDIDALGAKSVFNRSGGALSAGEIPADKPVTVCYDGTNFITQGGGISGNLTTTGAIPYVTSAGVLGQDGSNLCWDDTNNRLGVGTCAPSRPFEIKTTVTGDFFRLLTTADGGQAFDIGINTTDKSWYFSPDSSTSDYNIEFIANGGTRMLALDQSTANVRVGGTTEGNYRFDVQSSGTSGTFRAWDQGGAGSTLLEVRAGAAQSGDLLTIKNNAGTRAMGVTLNGIDGGVTTSTLYINGNTSISYGFVGGNSLVQSSFGDVSFKFYNGSSYVERARFIGTQTAGAGALQFTSIAVASLPTCNAGSKGAIASVNDSLAPAWGVTVANGGAAYAAVTCNGTNWTVTGI